MAAETFTSRDEIKRFSTPATADDLREVQFPANSREYILYAASSVKLAHTGTDAAAIGSDYLTIPGGSFVRLSIPGTHDGEGRNRDGGSIYLASDPGGASVEVLAL